jgi:hypothetical protein
LNLFLTRLTISEKMGNLATILSAPINDDESEVSIGKIDDAKIQTPARFRNCEILHTHNVDPRSPTVDIDRTPILVKYHTFLLTYNLFL